MGSHIFIVNNKSFIETIKSGYYQVVLPNSSNKNYIQSCISIQADLFAIRKGDIIFFYETSIGFRGVYEVLGGPYDDYSLRVGIKEYFEEPVNELRVLHDITDDGSLWNWAYKKSLGRGRAIIHLSPEEEEKLYRLILKNNDGVSISPYKPKRQINKRKMVLKILKNGKEVKWEKILEAWLIKNIDSGIKDIEVFTGSSEDIEFLANYVPCNLMGGAFDIILFHGKKTSYGFIRYKITLIELKKGIITKDAFVQADAYKKNLAQNLTNSDEEMIQIVLIGSSVADSTKELNKQMINRARRPILVSYKVVGNDIQFIVEE